MLTKCTFIQNVHFCVCEILKVGFSNNNSDWSFITTRTKGASCLIGHCSIFTPYHIQGGRVSPALTLHAQINTYWVWWQLMQFQCDFHNVNEIKNKYLSCQQLRCSMISFFAAAPHFTMNVLWKGWMYSCKKKKKDSGIWHNVLHVFTLLY